MDVLNCVNSLDFKKTIQAAQFRESVVGSALARKFKLLFQPCPHHRDHDHHKCCDFGLVDPINCNAWRCELQCCFHLDSLENGKFAFELFTYNEDGSKRDGKLKYCDADKFIYNAPKLEKLFVFEWKPIKQLILDLYDKDEVQLISFNKDNWNHDSAPVDLILVDAPTLLAQESVKEFNYLDLNIHHLYKHYE